MCFAFPHLLITQNLKGRIGFVIFAQPTQCLPPEFIEVVGGFLCERIKTSPQ